jgi:hypothetical protein
VITLIQRVLACFRAAVDAVDRAKPLPKWNQRARLERSEHWMVTTACDSRTVKVLETNVMPVTLPLGSIDIKKGNVLFAL